MDLVEAYAHWLEITPRSTGTRVRHAQAIDRLTRSGFGDLAALHPEALAAYVRARLRSVVPETVAADLGALYVVLGVLARERRFSRELLMELRLVAPKRRTRRARPIHFLSRAEVDRLAETARRIAPRIELAIRVAALTGCRVSELARLRREDFVLGAAPYLRVVSLPDFGEQGAIKTGEERTVPVERELKELVVARAPASGWIFATARARIGRAPKHPFLSRGTLERELQFARRAAGLPEWVTFAVLRHTRASWWVQDSRSIFKVAKWLGHDVLVCQRHYATLVPGYDPDCERADSSVGGGAAA